MIAGETSASKQRESGRLLDRPGRERPYRGRPLRRDGRPRLGLALSSGGARGLAHVGVLQVLEEEGIEIHAIAGSSMGAYVGSLWAAGFSGRELEELAAEMHDRRQVWKLADPMFPPVQGLFRGLKAKAHLERSLGNMCFEDLARTLLIVTLDLDSKERLVLRRGRLVDAVHASCAMPGIIAPVMLEGHRCVDGGVIDPLPVGALRRYAEVDRVLAVSVIPTFDDVDEGVCLLETPVPRRPWWRQFLGYFNSNINLLAHGNVVDTLRQSIRAAQIRMAHDSSARADLCLRPDQLTGAWFDYANFRKFIDSGRAVATARLDEIHALLREPVDRHD
ncbi:MAG TPA: patatin-like phospholipase family protein [Verrucomicrobiales bacterium]|nr:patatin-like phospholipase family protein [Verrucomicrobiales bacterium]